MVFTVATGTFPILFSFPLPPLIYDCLGGMLSLELLAQDLPVQDEGTRLHSFFVQFMITRSVFFHFFTNIRQAEFFCFFLAG